MKYSSAIAVVLTSLFVSPTLSFSVPGGNRHHRHHHQVTSKKVQKIRSNNRAFPSSSNKKQFQFQFELEAVPSPDILLSTISNIKAPLGSVSVLAFVILIHEAGHFLAARSFNINVEEFSVGVGPKLVGFTRTRNRINNTNEEESTLLSVSSDNSSITTGSTTTTEEEDNNKSNGIEFNLRAIPLGGYVRFPENYNTTLEFEFELKAEAKRKEINQIIQEQRRGQSGGTATDTVEISNGNGNGSFIRSIAKKTKDLSYNVFNKEQVKEERVAALQTLALRMEQEDKKKKNKSQQQPLQQWFKAIFNSKSKSRKEEISSINNNNERDVIIEEDGSVSVPPIEYYNDPNLLQNRHWAQRAVVLAGGVVFNILLAFILYFGELTVGSGMPRYMFDQGAMVNSMPRVDGPSVGLLNRGDVILSVNDMSLSTKTPSALESSEAISKFITTIRETTPGDELHLSIMNYETKQISQIDIAPRPINIADPNSPLSLGVMIGPNIQGTKLIKADSVIDAASIASNEVYQLTANTARGILSYLGTILSGGSAAPGQSLSGPIGVIQTGSEVVSTNDISVIIGFAAAISINLAVVNSLPLPALDGGQMLFVLAEAVTGRKIDQRIQESINSAALLFLLFVTFSTTVGDISKIAMK